MPFSIYKKTLRGCIIYLCCGRGKSQYKGGGEMKKIAGKIAIILILIMLANTFTSCFTTWAIDVIKNGKRGYPILGVLLFVFCLSLDFITLPIQLAIRSAYTPEADGEFLTEAIAALPETERASALEKINSLSEQQLVSVAKAMRALYALPRADRILLAEAIRCLPETEQAFFSETAKSLTDGEIAVLADEISSIPVVEMADQIKVLLETPSSDWGYREYAAERFVAGR